MRWQDLRDMGLNIFKKRNRSRTIWIGGSLGIFSLFAWIILLTGVTVTYTGDIHCEEECISYINVTSTYWRICFSDDFNLVQTNPNVPVEVYVPTRGKDNWRLFNPSEDCIERKNKYNYLPNRFKLIGHKEAGETVKWSIDKFDVDPLWIGEVKDIEIKCDYEIRYWNDTVYQLKDITLDIIDNNTGKIAQKIQQISVPVIVLKNESICIKEYAVIKEKTFEFKKEGYDCVMEGKELWCVKSNDGAHLGEYTDCNYGKSCIKFSIVDNKVDIKYKNSDVNWKHSLEAIQ